MISRLAVQHTQECGISMEPLPKSQRPIELQLHRVGKMFYRAKLSIFDSTLSCFGSCLALGCGLHCFLGFWGGLGLRPSTWPTWFALGSWSFQTPAQACHWTMLSWWTSAGVLDLTTRLLSATSALVQAEQCCKIAFLVSGLPFFNAYQI